MHILLSFVALQGKVLSKLSMYLHFLNWYKSWKDSIKNKINKKNKSWQPHFTKISEVVFFQKMHSSRHIHDTDIPFFTSHPLMPQFKINTALGIPVAGDMYSCRKSVLVKS